MTKEQLQQIEDFIFKAVQSTKKENSDLISELRRSVDGIRTEQRKVAEDLKDYVNTDIAWKEADKEWKDMATPSIEIMKKIQNSSSVIRWVAQTIILLGALVGGIAFLISKLK